MPGSRLELEPKEARPAWLGGAFSLHPRERSSHLEPHRVLKQQIEDFADANDSTPIESHVAPIDPSPARETTNETINLEENVAGGGSSTEIGAGVPVVTPLEVQDLD
ncbi:hypothetical protein RHGRI_001612 [Rhododendron griersonianum]|uniref:Uncharacterized protein n=1 Tax=Rhododendron griersonianum TaxID=479676 RepID=A0AAV6LKR8_9ERIC|nr:hypothetical protein RHGRI_001612 [Rhododendron griersonianum]